MKSVKGKEGGFTIIEIIVATAASAILVLVLAEIFYLTEGSWLRSKTVDAALEQERAAINLFKSRVLLMKPPKPRSAVEKNIDVNKSTFQFLSEPFQAKKYLGPLLTRFSVLPGDGGLSSLVFELNSPAATEMHYSYRKVLLKGLHSAFFTYTYDGKKESSMSNKNIPTLATFNWSYPESPDVFKEVSVRPRVLISGHCYLDSVSSSCRLR
jgi:type II secretory pathway pseudopilin PulG